MNAEQFNKILNGTFERVYDVLLAKADEYADEHDRLRNFKIAAALKETNPVEALSGMLAKHTVSIYDLMALEPEDFPPVEQWDEKIIDHINYLILLRALVTEALEGKRA